LPVPLTFTCWFAPHVTPPLAVTCPEDRAFLDELRARQTAWLDALGKALDHVREQRIGTTKLKGYAASIG
jgi:hypothetical protein